MAVAKRAGARKSKKPARRSLRTQLARLGALLAEKRPRTAQALRRPATLRARARLAKLFDGALPADVGAWFAWHDGQDGGDSLGPDSTWRALAIADIVEAHARLSAPAADIQLPWRATWVPLLGNGAGDYVVYDRETGALVTYHHDERSRPKHAPDLATFVARVVADLEEVEPPNAIFAPPSRLVGKKLARKPTVAQLARASRGTCYLYATSFVGQPRETVYTKLAQGRWLRVMGGTRKAVLARWQSFAKTPPAEDHGCYLTDRDVHFAIRTARDVSTTTVPVA